MFEVAESEYEKEFIISGFMKFLPLKSAGSIGLLHPRATCYNVHVLYMLFNVQNVHTIDYDHQL